MTSPANFGSGTSATFTLPLQITVSLGAPTPAHRSPRFQRVNRRWRRVFSRRSNRMKITTTAPAITPTFSAFRFRCQN